MGLVHGAGGIVHEVEAVIDTGFTEELTLPAELVDVLGLPSETTEQTILSNGSIVECAVHSAHIDWDGEEREILVQVAEGTPLIGMSLIYGFLLRLEGRDNGDVSLLSLTPTA